MSNQKQNNTSSPTRERAGMLWKLAPSCMFYCFLFGVTFCTSDRFQTMVAGSCSKVVMLANRFWSRDLAQNSLETPIFGILLSQPSNSGTCGIGKNRVASKTSKTITAWWLTANLKQMPLTSFPYTTQIWIAVRKLVPTSNFTASFSCSANSLLRTTFRPWKLAAVPKL